MTRRDKNESPKIRLICEEASCSELNDGGGLGALAVDSKISDKKKDLFWWK